MRFRQMILLNVVGFIVVVGLLIAGYIYYFNHSNYISTNDASVQVKAASVTAIASGRLVAWHVADNDTVTKGELLGREQLPTGRMVDITAPIGGQVLQQAGVQNQVVAPGTLLAVLGNLSQEYVVANIPETVIRHVRTGQTVDIYIDGFPGTTFSGTVTNVGALSAAYTSMVPTSQAAGNYTKEVQRVPVDVSLSGNEGKLVLPAMNASIRIHRNNP